MLNYQRWCVDGALSLDTNVRLQFLTEVYSCIPAELSGSLGCCIGHSLCHVIWILHSVKWSNVAIICPCTGNSCNSVVILKLQSGLSRIKQNSVKLI